MSQFSNLLEKEISRKEFLITLGLGIASILGFSTIIKLLFGKSDKEHPTVGTSTYGNERSRPKV